MYCPRLDHFRRIMPDGKIGVCGHMTNGKSYDDLKSLDSSDWLSSLRSKMYLDKWPDECVRCQRDETAGRKSIRQHSFDRDSILRPHRENYLIVGGILDNICNAACQFCDERKSSKIGHLMHGAGYQLMDNTAAFNTIPRDRIIELDINGGEPSNSPNYAALLDDPPENVKIIRINTNASRFMPNIIPLLDKGIKVIVTISLDGVGPIYEYARWPLRWSTFTEVVDRYKAIQHDNLSLDFWTTVSAYTVSDMINITNYARSVDIPISFGRLTSPSVLDVRYTNPLTLPAKHIEGVAVDEDNTQALLDYLRRQDSLRGTNFEDRYNWS